MTGNAFNLKRLTTRSLPLFALLLLLAGCAPGDSQSTDEKTKAKKIESLTEAQVSQREVALAAKDRLFEGLLAALMDSIKKNGVAESIEVCKSQAPKLAKSVGNENEVRIGRTSFQLRNSDNIPPAWAEPFVQDRTDEEVNVQLADDALGVLLPIRLKATCLMCHGPTETMMPEVVKAIEDYYPRDQATGFSEGDLRGYFWVEVPNQE